MVVLTSPDAALHLWKRFKKVNKEETQNLVKNQEKSLNKSVIDKKQTNQSSSSSCSSLDISKRTITQEKLFKLQCQKQSKKTTHGSSFNSDSSSTISVDRKRRYLKSDHYRSDIREHCVNVSGVLHLKKPLSSNTDNDKNYYEDRGRMPPINWENIRNSTVSQDKKPEKIKKAEMQKESIQTIVKSKSQISDEFSNFVENSVYYKSAYNTEGNIEKNINAIDSPIFKIQQRINKKPLNTIKISASVKSSFLKTSFDFHLMNKIDTFRAIDPMAIEREDNRYNYKYAATQNENNHRSYFKEKLVENKSFMKDAEPLLLENSKCDVPKQLKKQLNQDDSYVKINQGYSQYQDCKISREKQTKDNCPTHECDDYDRITYINSLTDRENAAKRESRKKEMAYEDDLFTFVQMTPESSSSQINTSLPTTRKINPHSFPFDRIKANCREKRQINKTLDSDDTLNASSDFENLSGSIVPMRINFEALKKKMTKITSLSNDHVNENRNILLDDDKVLENKNQLLNRCLRASHDYSKTCENNVVEITEVKVGSKPEPLFKPISTRYFAKPSIGSKDLNNDNTINNIGISQKQEDKVNIDYQNRNTNNNSSIASTSITGVDCKSNFNEFHQEDTQIDSGLCIKSTDNSLSTPDSSEIRLDLGTGNKTNCNARNQVNTTKSSGDTEPLRCIKNNEMDCEDIIDYDAFDIENVELFFPALTVENLKQPFTNKKITSIVNEDSSKSLESDFEISNDKYSSTSASISSNLNSDSENPSSPSSQFNFNGNIFENVNIELSALTTDGLNYDNNQTQKIEFKNPTSLLKNEDAPLTSDTSGIVVKKIEKLCKQKDACKEDAIQNFNRSCNETSLQDTEKPKPSKENVITTLCKSKKMQKYRSTLENYKHKCKSEASIKQENQNIQQAGNASLNEEQKLLQRPILKEIQKHLQLTFRPFV